MGWNTGSCDVPQLRNYDQALGYWKNTLPYKGSSMTAPRQLDASRRKRFISITHRDYAPVPRVECTLHGTDVVTYYADNSIRIEAYASHLTDSFAGQLLDHSDGIECAMNSPLGSIVWVRVKPDRDPTYGEWRGYKASVLYARQVEGTRMWTVEENLSKISPINEYKIDQTKARELFKAHPNYKSYILWLKAVHAMGHGRKMGGHHRFDAQDVVELLDAGTENFGEIAEDNWTPEDLRHAIYKEGRAVSLVEHPYLPHSVYMMQSYDRYAYLKNWAQRSSTWSGVFYRWR